MQPLDDAEAFEQGDGAVDAGTVDARAGADNFAHGLRLFVLQGAEDGQAGLGQALAVGFHQGLKLFQRFAHDANITQIATNLQYCERTAYAGSMSIVEQGKRGAEHLGDAPVPQAPHIDTELGAYENIIKGFRLVKLPDQEVADGAKHDVQVRPLLLSEPPVFALVHAMAEYRPMVYASRHGRPAVMGMLSPNYDAHGKVRLPSIKVLPLKQALPLTTKQLPDANMAVMLTGAANGEGVGVGTHAGGAAHDFEHRNTMAGALSLDDPSIAIDHKNHEVRKNQSSVATGLTNGELGDLYIPDESNDGFPGFGEPIVFNAATIHAKDKIFIPDSFLGSAEAYGAYYGEEASRIFMGAGLRTLQQRRGDQIFGQLDRLAEEL